MYKKITLLIALVTLTIAINAQVKTNFNNTEKLKRQNMITNKFYYQIHSPPMQQNFNS